MRFFAFLFGALVACAPTVAPAAPLPDGPDLAELGDVLELPDPLPIPEVGYPAVLENWHTVPVVTVDEAHRPRNPIAAARLLGGC